MTWRSLGGLAAVMAFGGGATCQKAFDDATQMEPDLPPAARPLAPRFVSDGVERTVTDPANGLRWALEVRQEVASVSQSVDLWLSREDGTPVFAGAVPSCFGREPFRADPDVKHGRISQCYLARFDVSGGLATFRMYLGGTWAHTLTLPTAPALADSDGDGWNDALELLLGTRPDHGDTDGDERNDPEDDNPLASNLPAPLGTVEDPRITATRAVIAAAVADLPACLPDRPLLIIGPKVGQQMLPHRTCQQLYLVEDWAVARARMALLPLDGKVPTGPDAVAEAALAGGLPRAKVEVKSVFGAEATVHIIQMGGRTIKQMEKRSGVWTVLDKQVMLATP